jgi:hypothetical protein
LKSTILKKVPTTMCRCKVRESIGYRNMMSFVDVPNQWGYARYHPKEEALAIKSDESLDEGFFESMIVLKDRGRTSRC